jgi:hypothetical protein
MIFFSNGMEKLDPVYAGLNFLNITKTIVPDTIRRAKTISIIRKTRAGPCTCPKEKIGGISRLSIGNHATGRENAFPRRFITTYCTPILRWFASQRLVKTA